MHVHNPSVMIKLLPSTVFNCPDVPFSESLTIIHCLCHSLHMPCQPNLGHEQKGQCPLGQPVSFPVG
jgi:hypothetical protein